MRELLNFIELIDKYKKAKVEHDSEPDDAEYPSPELERLWVVENELKASFRQAILEAISGRS